MERNWRNKVNDKVLSYKRGKEQKKSPNYFMAAGLNSYLSNEAPNRILFCTNYTDDSDSSRKW